MTFTLEIQPIDDELPIYQEVEQSPDVVVEEREITDDSDDEEQEQEQKPTITKQPSKFSTLKSAFSGDAQKPHAQPEFVFHQSPAPTLVNEVQSDRKPFVAKLPWKEASNYKSYKTAMRTALHIDRD